MTNIIALTDLCNWKLKAGSHKWPGPHGGTCINEAAIVAAGFEYKSVSKASDCPPCFSPVVSAYLIQLNDHLNDVDRQQLIRFVTRLSGSRDTDAVEQKRLEFIVIETVRRIVSIAMDAAMLSECATECRAVRTLAEASAALAKAADEANVAANQACRVANAAYIADQARSIAANTADHAVNAAKYVVGTATVLAANAADIAANSSTMIKKSLTHHCIDIVEGALAIGNQATDVDAALVVARMNEVRTRGVVGVL